ncbi:sulfatase [Bythopirellula polymerisocia]|uniref:Choline-sulfatase n=1 Tax=Bythopirellula polymerisocia TaxID=2528003 RepID=A0A5C6CC53_9BACT|nr:Choline-sulfatase [Bythopirellula polymerisocia]
MQKLLQTLIGTQILFAVSVSASAEHSKPNVLFFAVDDMNDWVGALGHEQAITPNMDRLARSGVNFVNAHTAGVFCAPSRSAIFTGRHASTTGCYTTQVYFHDHPEIIPLQKVLQEGGYATFGAGKLFHHPAGFVDRRGWDEFFLRKEEQKKRGWPLDSWTVDDPALPIPYPNSIFNHDRKPANEFFLEWGRVLNENEEKMADTIRTEWACDLLRKKHNRPVFVAVGLYAPHFPNYAPEKYFDLYDPDKIELPPCRADDLEDLPPKIRKAKEARAAHHKRLERLGAVDDAILGYLACISYADAMLGRLLDAIESGPNADNTIVVLWSDHGYHHGEKFDWGKHTLWERTSNVPFIWSGPGITRGVEVNATVSLMDMFPTLIQLCAVPDGMSRDGVSLAPVLKDPALAKDRDILLPGMKPGEYAMMNQDWRYIHYADDTEELYHVKQDPNEWDNLALHPEYKDIKRELEAAAPQAFASPGPNRGEIKLVIKGEDFDWAPKKRAAP